MDGSPLTTHLRGVDADLVRGVKGERPDRKNAHGRTDQTHVPHQAAVLQAIGDAVESVAVRQKEENRRRQFFFQQSKTNHPPPFF